MQSVSLNHVSPGQAADGVCPKSAMIKAAFRQLASFSDTDSYRFLLCFVKHFILNRMLLLQVLRHSTEDLGCGA